MNLAKQFTSKKYLRNDHECFLFDDVILTFLSLALAAAACMALAGEERAAACV